MAETSLSITYYVAHCEKSYTAVFTARIPLMVHDCRQRRKCIPRIFR